MSLSKNDQKHLSAISDFFPTDLNGFLRSFSSNFLDSDFATFQFKNSGLMQYWDDQALPRRQTNTSKFTNSILELANSLAPPHPDEANLLLMRLSTEFSVFSALWAKKLDTEPRPPSDYNDFLVNFRQPFVYQIHNALDGLSEDTEKVIIQILFDYFQGSVLFSSVYPQVAGEQKGTMYPPGTILAYGLIARTLKNNPDLFELMEKKEKKTGTTYFADWEIQRLKKGSKQDKKNADSLEKLRGFSDELNSKLIFGRFPEKWLYQQIEKLYPSQEEQKHELLKYGFAPIAEHGPADAYDNFCAQIDYFAVLATHCSDARDFYHAAHAVYVESYPDTTRRFENDFYLLDYVRKKIWPAENYNAKNGRADLYNTCYRMDANIACTILHNNALGIRRYHEPEIDNLQIMEPDKQTTIVPKNEWLQWLRDENLSKAIDWEGGWINGKSINFNRLPPRQRFNPLVILTSAEDLGQFTDKSAIPPAPRLANHAVASGQSILAYDAAYAKAVMTPQAETLSIPENLPKEPPSEMNMQDILLEQIFRLQELVERFEKLEPGDRLNVGQNVYQEIWDAYQQGGQVPMIRHLSGRIIKPGKNHEAPPEDTQPVHLLDDDLFNLAIMLEKAAKKLEKALQGKTVKVIIYANPDERPILAPRTDGSNGSEDHAIKDPSEDMKVIRDEMKKRGMTQTEVDKHMQQHYSDNWHSGKTSALLGGGLPASARDVNSVLQLLIELDAGVWMRRISPNHLIIPGPNYHLLAEHSYDGQVHLQDGAASIGLYQDPRTGELSVTIEQPGRPPIIVRPREDDTVRDINAILKETRKSLPRGLEI